MTTTRHGSRGALTFPTAGLVLLVACLLGPQGARAQWTQPDANNNISNTNTGNVGVGTTIPGFRFEVRGGSSRNIASFTGDGDSVGYAGFKIQAFTTSGIASNRTASFNFHMRKDSWYGGDGSGPSFIIETTSTAGGFAAPFLITPTNDVILNGGQGASGLSYGRVGIGATSPLSLLHVNGATRPTLTITDSAAARARLFRTTGTQSDFSHNANFDGAGWALDDAAAGGSSLSLGNNFIGFNQWTAGSGHRTTTTPFYIHSSGNVGVGNTAPAAKLSVSDAAAWPANNIGAVHVSASNTVGAGLNLHATGAGGRNWLLVSTASGSSPGGGTFGIFDATLGGAPAYRFVLNSSGNVGIGVLAPAHKLDVAGNVNASGLCLGGSCKSSWADVDGGQWTTSGANISNANTGNVGVGVATPAAKLHVGGGGRIDGSLGRVHLGASAVAGARGLEFVEENATTFSIRHHDPGVAWRNIAINPHGGRVGVGTVNPLGPLSVGDASVDGSDGFLVIGKKSGASTRQYRLGFDANHNFVIGDYGGNNAAGPWTSPFAINWQAPSNSLYVNSAGAVGFGTATPSAKLHIISADDTVAPALSIRQDTNPLFGFDFTLDTNVNGNLSVKRVNNGSSASLLTLDRVNGNVGVGAGATAPAHTLDVAGSVNATGLCLGGSCKSSWSEVGGGGASQWVNGPQGVISYGAGRVGVGTDNPGHTLDVASGAQWAARFRKTDATHGGIIVEAAAGYNPNVALSAGGAVKWYMNSNVAAGDSLQFWEATGSTPRFTLTQAGNLGVGTATPVRGLQVSGPNGSVGSEFVLENTGMPANNRKLNLWGNAAAGASGRFFLRLLNDAGDATTREFMSFDNATGSIGVGTSSPTQMLDINGLGEVKARAAGTISAAIQLSESHGAATWSEWQQFFDRLRLNTHDGTTTRPDVMSILPNGNVGIGKATPTVALDVVGDIKATGSVSATYQDVAEWVPSTQSLSAGTVVVLDTGRNNHVLASTTAYDTRVAGVVSAQPGVILGVGGEDKVMVATTGRVRMRVDATRAPIKVGDLLVTGEVEGVAMKSVPVDLGGTPIHRPGTIIGKALEPLAKGVGEILVLLSLQ